MKKWILNWLFGTDNVETYTELLYKCMNYCKKHMDSVDAHIETLKESKADLEIIRKLIKVCENHGINADEEIKQIKL